MKLGISIKLDVTKIDKARLFQGKTGAKYLDLTTFIDTDNPGQYGDHGPISQSATQEQRAQGDKRIREGAVSKSLETTYS